MRFQPCVVLLLLASLAAAKTQRVRRELRMLSQAERAELIDALWTMKKIVNITEANYRSYDYFTVKHAVAVGDTRGDQGHFGPCFMTYHRAILLEFEAAMLSIAPKLQALPYWGASLDTETCHYFQDQDFAFGPKYFGGCTGNASAKYQVTDGVFAYWPIANFNPEEYIPAEFREGALAQYSGSPHGTIRGSHNQMNTPTTTRLPKHGGVPSLDRHAYPVYTQENFDLCTGARWV